MIYGNEGVSAEDGWTKVGNAVAPTDLWVCLGLSLLAIATIPISIDVYDYVKKRRSQDVSDEF
jgi:hypothetical protein